MSGHQRPKVFISYARKDGAVLAQCLQADLAAQYFDAWLDTQRLAGGGTWTQDIEQALDACDVVLALLEEQYLTTRLTYVTAPPTVANYIERPEGLRALRDTLFSDCSRQPIALTALAGMGGIGKRVLAKALTEDEAVQHAFPDGVVWITVGREWSSDLVPASHVVGKALGEDWEKHKDPLACQNE